MVGIQGIGGVPEPVNSKPAQGKNSTPAAPSDAPSDGVEISSAAAEASAAKAALSAQQTQSPIREERVAEAKANIEQGAHKLQEVVLQVASRLTKFVE